MSCNDTMAKLDVTMAFPVVLHRMLTDIENRPAMNRLSGIVSWVDHGRAFKIHDKKVSSNISHIGVMNVSDPSNP